MKDVWIVFFTQTDHHEDKVLKLMGEGTFSRVIEALDTHENCKVAIKVVRAIKKFIDDAEFEVKMLNDLKKNDPTNEQYVLISIYGNLIHSYCIQLISSFMYNGHLCIVFPKYGMSLFDFLNYNNRKGFTLLQVRDVAFKLLKAIKFIHNLKLIHTDLKPENILLVNSEYNNEDV